jgi:hypothetical protein
VRWVTRVVKNAPKESPFHRTNWAYLVSGLDLLCRGAEFFAVSGGNNQEWAGLHSYRNARRPTMTGNPYIQRQSDEPQDWQQLARENGSLRAIIGELLIKNQKLRWELQGHACCWVRTPSS